MSDQPPRNLSEIGHLFLSSVRQRHTNGTPLPRRRPPGGLRPLHREVDPGLPTDDLAPAANAARADAPAGPPVRSPLSIDLTPEEFADAFNDSGESGDADETGEEVAGVDSEPTGGEAVRLPPVTALLGAHLSGEHSRRARDYARRLAAAGQRVGLIEADAAQFRLTCFEATPDACDHEPGPGDGPAEGGDRPEPAAAEFFDPRAMTAALDELSWDLDRWLVVLPTDRAAASRGLLRRVGHWAMLCTCDPDGVVSSYRTLKGLADGFAEGEPRPRLSLAFLDAKTPAAAEKARRKLSDVCEKFLGWPVEADADAAEGGDPTTDADEAGAASEHLVLCCRPASDKGHFADAPQWLVLSTFLDRACRQREERADPLELRADTPTETKLAPQREANPDVEKPMQEPTQATQESSNWDEPQRAAAARPARPASPAAPPIPLFLSTGGPGSGPAPAAPAPAAEAMAQVIDLADASEGAILSAVLRQDQNELVECPVRTPTCPGARLAVTRDRRLALLAVTRQGLGDLRAIGLAFRWLVENRALIAMAVPQFAIDAHQHPHLRLLVDHADLTANLLQPLLQSDTVTVQAYRKLRWGAKTGLLLEAA